LRHKLRETLYRFIDQGKLVLGICNGFHTAGRPSLFQRWRTTCGDAGSQ
jgi:phosphoribosylformylglycinamidine (FGAM) synthase-like amidotransferase family enzyme